MMTIDEFIEANGGVEGEHPFWTLADWRQDVIDGNTRSGYWDWAYAREEQDAGT